VGRPEIHQSGIERLPATETIATISSRNFSAALATRAMISFAEGRGTKRFSVDSSATAASQRWTNCPVARFPEMTQLSSDSTRRKFFIQTKAGEVNNRAASVADSEICFDGGKFFRNANSYSPNGCSGRRRA